MFQIFLIAIATNAMKSLRGRYDRNSGEIFTAGRQLVFS
jgi:hypothetical protein